MTAVQHKEHIKLYANQAWQAMYVGLNNYGIKYGKDYTGVSMHNSIMVLSFNLMMRNTGAWKKLNSIQTELSQMLHLEDNICIRLGFSGMDYRIEIPKPRHLHDTVVIDDVLRCSDGLKVGIGISVINNKPEILDFSSNTSGHLLISGSTRCGKTNIAKLILKSLIKNNTPDKVRFVIIDTVKAKVKYSVLTNSSHLATDIIDTEKKAVIALKWLKEEIVRRGGTVQGYKKIIIVIDEAAQLLNEEIKGLISFIASTGAESGIHIIASTQYPNVDSLGGRNSKGNMTRRLCGQVDDGPSSTNATGKKEAGAEKLMVPGDFLSVSPNGLVRVATPEITDSDFGSIDRGGMKPLFKLNSPPDQPPSRVTSVTPPIKACFDSIDDRLLWLALTGKNSKTGKPLGADVIRKVAAKLGKPMGNNTAHEYVLFARKMKQRSTR